MTSVASPPLSGLALLAEGYRYPDAAMEPLLSEAPDGLPAAAAQAWTRFTRALGGLAPGRREELFTRTLDLNPVAAPYVGYQLYGEDYRRGAFMATMSRELARLGLGEEGELPDHLGCVLRYLAAAEEATEAPAREVVDVTAQALRSMARQLAGVDRANPYRHLVRATQAALAAVEGGAGRDGRGVQGGGARGGGARGGGAPGDELARGSRTVHGDEAAPGSGAVPGEAAVIPDGPLPLNAEDTP